MIPYAPSCMTGVRVGVFLRVTSQWLITYSGAYSRDQLVYFVHAIVKKDGLIIFQSLEDWNELLVDRQECTAVKVGNFSMTVSELVKWSVDLCVTSRQKLIMMDANEKGSTHGCHSQCQQRYGDLPLIQSWWKGWCELFFVASTCRLVGREVRRLDGVDDGFG